MNLLWKLNRIAAMERGEIPWRVRQVLHGWMQRGGLGVVHTPPPASTGEGCAWPHEWPTELDARKYRDAADRILRGEFRIFALDPAQLGFPPDWNRDPKSGRVAPMSFGKTLDYRDERLVGDIKYLWEPSRHAELVTLAQAWHLTGDPRYSDGCRVLLQSWLEQCPYMRGVHWTSSLEHGVRLLNWALTWSLLGGRRSMLFDTEEGRVFRDRWVASVYQHCHFIVGHISRYSSANNHLLGELLGLFIASSVWPLWRESPQWREFAAHEFQEQALVQNADDGVNREQAVWYHHEVADMMLVAGLIARAGNSEFDPAYWRRLESMLEFITSIMDSGGHVPSFGDADDAVIARLDPAPNASVYASLLATGAVLFERPDFALKAGGFDDKSRWLLGDGAKARFEAVRSSGRTQPPLRREFPDGGYYVLGDRFDMPEEVRIVLDAGPLGYRSIAAHGHADALSFTMSVAGTEILIDPGTFAYHTQKTWRDYFRGTSAHNTIRIDGCDQSRASGNFMWLSHARARCTKFQVCTEVEVVVAEHDGYRRLADPVTHRREVRFDRRHRIVTVIDDLTCSDRHQVEIFWHFSEHCVLEAAEEGVLVQAGDVGVKLDTSPDVSYEIVRGSEQPPLGWRSLRFDERVLSPTLRGATTIAGDTRIVTQIEVLPQTPLAGQALYQRSCTADSVE